MKKGIVPLAMALMASMLSSCFPTRYLDVSGVAYQTIRGKRIVAEDKIPSNAKIIVYCVVDSDGVLDVIVRNNTDKIMTIDRTRTFFQDGKGNSTPYYDPNIASNTTSTTTGKVTSVSVNQGAVARSVGVSGSIVTALDGVTKGVENSSYTTNTNTLHVIDQPKGEIGPHGRASLGRRFQITGVGQDFLGQVIRQSNNDVCNSFTADKTYASCNICISYSLNDGKSYETIITDIFANTLLVSKVREKGKVNDALRRLYSQKKDMFSDTWFLLHFESNYDGYNAYYSTRSILNYK